jgi:hypothetical protein
VCHTIPGVGFFRVLYATTVDSREESVDPSDVCWI